MSDDRGLQTVADAVDALTQPMRNVERIYDRDAHRNRRLRRVWETNQPSLLVQLAAAVIPGEVYAEDQNGARLVPRSIPPAQLEAINAIIAIEAGAARWCLRLNLTLRDDPTSNIRALVGAHTDSDTTAHILADLKRWYGWAATLTGWQIPPWTPQAPCPLCETRQLRVRLDRNTATCMACSESWSHDTIGLLAEHCRAYTAWSRAQAYSARLRAAQLRREATPA